MELEGLMGHAEEEDMGGVQAAFLTSEYCSMVAKDGHARTVRTGEASNSDKARQKRIGLSNPRYITQIAELGEKVVPRKDQGPGQGRGRRARPRVEPGL